MSKQVFVEKGNPILIFSEDTIDLSEKMQREMHLFVEALMKLNPRLSYQDSVVTYLLNKIAELLKELNALKFKTIKP